MKPRCFLLYGQWLCVGRGDLGMGDTPLESIRSWYVKRILRHTRADERG